MSSATIIIEPALPCSECGNPTTLAFVRPSDEALIVHVPTLAGSYVLKPLCQRCLERLVEPTAQGICALRQQSER